MKICVFGAGAIGGYMAGELALAGQSFGVPADRLCLRGNGSYAAGLAVIATCLFLILS